MKRICIISTGGTVTMQRNTDGVLIPHNNVSELLETIPNLTNYADLTVKGLFHVDSSDISPKNWVEMAKTVAELYDDYDGFVITHGTDTMAYTATALSFMLGKLGKPVILTGAQIPMSDIASDAQSNLTNAVRAASDDLAEVAIMFGDYLLRGNRSTKQHEFTLNSFSSPNYPELAKLGVELRMNKHCFRRNDDPLELRTNLVSNVAVIKLFPGITNEHILGMVPPRTQGVVIEAYGSGNIPLGVGGIENAIDEIIEQDIVVAIGTQCLSGSVEYFRYAGGHFLKKRGALSCQDMTKEASIIKMMWALGQSQDKQEIQHIFENDQVGEMSHHA